MDGVVNLSFEIPFLISVSMYEEADVLTELVRNGKYKDGKKVGPVRLALPFQAAGIVDETAQERQLALDLLCAWHEIGRRSYLVQAMIRNCVTVHASRFVWRSVTCIGMSQSAGVLGSVTNLLCLRTRSGALSIRPISCAA
jgi:hypothetical protein